jgi:aspartate-semialdehyde dehydrogenase
MKTALIAGATGLVGSELIKILVNDPNYEKIIVISRRELKTNSPKLEVIITPFENLNEVTLPCPIDECFCTLGTTQKKSGKTGLFKVDFEYVLQIAELSALTARKFLVVSSRGRIPNHPSST